MLACRDSTQCSEITGSCARRHAVIVSSPVMPLHLARIRCPVSTLPKGSFDPACCNVAWKQSVFFCRMVLGENRRIYTISNYSRETSCGYAEDCTEPPSAQIRNRAYS